MQVEDQVTDVVVVGENSESVAAVLEANGISVKTDEVYTLTTKPEFNSADVELARILDKYKPSKWWRALTEYVNEKDQPSRFIDYKKLERNKYAPWGRGEFA
jgi:thioredoxin reductase